jgi:hypothetical protein
MARSLRNGRFTWLLLVALAATATLVGSYLGGGRSIATARKTICVKKQAGGGCAVRPRTVAIGAQNGFTKLRWSKWGGKHAVGHGKLNGVSVGPAEGLLTLYHIRRCRGHRWYTRLTAKYGKHHRKTYVKGYPNDPCR